MATITNTMTNVREVPYGDVWVAAWAMGNADTGTPVTQSGSSDRSIQFSGTFGSATLTCEGSNDGTVYTVLTDPQGNAISKTTASIEAISELTRYIRVSSTGGTGTAVTATLLMKGHRE